MGNSQWTRVFIISQWKLSIGQPLSSQWTSLNRINSQWTISKAKLYNPKKITEIFSKRQIFLMLRIYSRNRVSVQVHYTRSELCEAAAAAQPLHTPRPRGANNPSHPHPEWLNNPSTPRPGGRGLSSFVNYIFRPRGVTFSDIFVLFFRHIFRLILNLYL